MNEDYVSLEVAKLLKKKGFDWECENGYYQWYSDANPDISLLSVDDKDIKDGWWWNGIPAPTLWQAAKWLREKHDLHISVDVYTDTSLDADGRVCEEWTYWDFNIISTSSGRRVVDENDEYESYESALSAGIETALNLI